MTPFKISIQKEPECHIYEVTGYFDENAKLPSIEDAPAVKVDLDKVKGINSYGIRSWCLWFKPLPKNIKVALHHCPPLFVKAMNTVSGFLIPNMEVISFYVPYYSETTEIRKNVLYTKGQHFDSSGISHPEVNDADGSLLILDADKSYFKFLDYKL